MFSILFPKIIISVNSFFKKSLSGLCDDANRLLLRCSREEVVTCFVLLVTLAVYRFIFVINLPVSFDEAWTYLYFSSEGFIVSLSHYPLPNNHVLNSILSSFTFLLPIDDLVALRLPSYLIGLVTSVSFYLLCRKVVGLNVSFLFTVVLSLSFYPFIYGIQSRGYGTTMLSAIVLIGTGWSICRTLKDWHLLVYVAASCIGYAAVPSFLYSHALITIFVGGVILIQRRWGNLLKFALVNLSVVALVLLFYLPIILNSGFSSLSSNKFILKKQRVEILGELLGHFRNSFDQLFGNFWWFLIALIIGFFLLARRKKIAEVSLLLWIAAISILIPVVHGVLPFARTWVHLLIPVILLLAMGTQYSLGKWIDKRVSLLVLIPLTIMLHLRLESRIANVEQFSFEAKTAFEILASNPESDSYVNTILVGPDILFYQTTSKSPLDHLNYEYSEVTEEEILERQEHYVVVDAGINLPESKYERLLDGKFVHVFQRR